MSHVLHAAGAPEGITLNAEGALSLASSYMSAVGIEQWDIDAAVDNAYVNFDRSIRQIAVTLSFASTPLCDFFGPGGLPTEFMRYCSMSTNLVGQVTPTLELIARLIISGPQQILSQVNELAGVAADVTGDVKGLGNLAAQAGGLVSALSQSVASTGTIAPELLAEAQALLANGGNLTTVFSNLFSSISLEDPPSAPPFAPGTPMPPPPPPFTFDQLLQPGVITGLVNDGRSFVNEQCGVISTITEQSATEICSSFTSLRICVLNNMQEIVGTSGGAASGSTTYTSGASSSWTLPQNLSAPLNNCTSESVLTLVNAIRPLVPLLDLLFDKTKALLIPAYDIGREGLNQAITNWPFSQAFQDTVLRLQKASGRQASSRAHWTSKPRVNFHQLVAIATDDRTDGRICSFFADRPVRPFEGLLEDQFADLHRVCTLLCRVLLDDVRLHTEAHTHP